MNRNVLLKGIFDKVGGLFVFLTFLILVGEVYSWLYYGHWAGLSLDTFLQAIGVVPQHDPHSWWSNPTKWIGMHTVVTFLVHDVPLWVWPMIIWGWAQGWWYKIHLKQQRSR